MFRRLGGGWRLSAVLYHRGWGLARFGRHAEAVSVYQEAIDVADSAGVYNTVQWATADLGLTLLALGRVDEASAWRTLPETPCTTGVAAHPGAVLVPAALHRLRRGRRCSPAS